MFGINLFNPLTDAKLKDNTAKSVSDCFDRRYRVSSVRPAGKDKYDVRLEDGSHMSVKVGKKTNLFGEEQTFIKDVDEWKWF